VEEMQFQTSDWSNREKTATLGRVLNAQNVIRGQLMKMGNTIFWTATVLDVNTAQILSSSRQQLNSLDDVWGNNLSNFSQQVVSQLPAPNLFVGRWEYSFNNWRNVIDPSYWTDRNRPNSALVCILNIQANGTVTIERFDTITATSNVTERLFSDNERVVNYGRLNQNGRGTGTYTSITKNRDGNFVTNITLRLSGVDSGIPSSQTIIATLYPSNPNRFTTRQVFNWYSISQTNGRTTREGATYQSGGSDGTFYFYKIN
jgi:hypothetical protein